MDSCSIFSLLPDMPELPEVETMARQLHRLCEGEVLGQVTVLQSGVIRPLLPHEFTDATEGRRILGVTRRAKMVVMLLDDGHRIVIHPRMTGAPLVTSHEGQWPSALCLWWPLGSGARLGYRDIRRFGRVRVLSQDEWKLLDASLGVEPLSASATTGVWSKLLTNTKRPIKSVLLDQDRIVGIGNIYAAEACWAARIWPGTPAETLTRDQVQALRRVTRSLLRRSIHLGGTSSRDYIDPTGARGTFGGYLRVYGRQGLPCFRCGTLLERTTLWEQRSTCWCPSCQPAPRETPRRRGNMKVKTTASG